MIEVEYGSAPDHFVVNEGNLVLLVTKKPNIWLGEFDRVGDGPQMYSDEDWIYLKKPTFGLVQPQESVEGHLLPLVNGSTIQHPVAKLSYLTFAAAGSADTIAEVVRGELNTILRGTWDSHAEWIEQLGRRPYSWPDTPRIAAHMPRKKK